MTHRTHPQQRLVSTLRVSTRKKGRRWIGNSKTKQFLRNASFRLAARHKGNKTPMKHSMIQHRESEIFKYLSSHLFPAVTQVGQWHDFWRACSLFAVRLAWFKRSVGASDATRDTNKLYARKKSCSYINQCLSFAHFGGWLAASFIQNKEYSNLVVFFNMSQCIICSPVCRFCTTWLLSCKRPIQGVIGRVISNQTSA